MSKLNGDTKIIVDLINSRFDDVKDQLSETKKSQQKLLENHCSRIRGLEKWKNNLTGKIAVLVAVITVAVSYILK